MNRVSMNQVGAVRHLATTLFGARRPRATVGRRIALTIGAALTVATASVALPAAADGYVTSSTWYVSYGNTITQGTVTWHSESNYVNFSGLVKATSGNCALTNFYTYPNGSAYKTGFTTCSGSQSFNFNQTSEAGPLKYADIVLTVNDSHVRQDNCWSIDRYCSSGTSG